MTTFKQERDRLAAFAPNPPDELRDAEAIGWGIIEGNSCDVVDLVWLYGRDWYHVWWYGVWAVSVYKGRLFDTEEEAREAMKTVRDEGSIYQAAES